MVVHRHENNFFNKYQQHNEKHLAKKQLFWKKNTQCCFLKRTIMEKSFFLSGQFLLFYQFFFAIMKKLTMTLFFECLNLCFIQKFPSFLNAEKDTHQRKRWWFWLGGKQRKGEMKLTFVPSYLVSTARFVSQKVSDNKSFLFGALFWLFVQGVD